MLLIGLSCNQGHPELKVRVCAHSVCPVCDIWLFKKKKLFAFKKKTKKQPLGRRKVLLDDLTFTFFRGKKKKGIGEGPGSLPTQTHLICVNQDPAARL